MFKKIKEFFFGTPSNTAPIIVAPYKVEVPAAVVEVPQLKKCGCGRSASGLCEGLHALSANEWAAKTAPAVEMPAKKPRKPRTPSVKVAATQTAAVKRVSNAVAITAPKKPKSKKV